MTKENKCANSIRGGSSIAAISMILVLYSPTAAWSQTVAAPAASESDVPASAPTAPAPSDAGLGDIVVTASKRAENVQRAALSVTALGAEALQQRQIVDFGQLAGLAPSVQFQPSFVNLTYIRGIGNYTTNPAVDQSVAYNVDGIYIDRAYGTPNQLFDLERVELLRGPQGTLQGRNSTGGSVNLITARPVLGDLKARASISYGNYSALVTEGMVNIPISDTMALRISGAHSSHDPYFDNGSGDGNSYGARARLLFEPTSRLSILATAETTGRREDGPGASLCPPKSAEPACIGVPWEPFSGLPGVGNDPITNIVESNYLHVKNTAVYAEVNYDLGFGALTWVPSYRHLNYSIVQTVSNAFGIALGARDNMHSEELRLSSKPSSPVTWVVGAYYGRQTSQERSYFLTGVGASISVDEPGFDPVGHVYDKNDVQRYAYRSQSLFGQVTVPIFAGLRVTAGGRYTQDRKEMDGNVALVTGPGSVSSADYSVMQKASHFNYKAGLEFDPASGVMLYGNYSTGFKAGGTNGVPTGSGIQVTFGPEKIRAFQAGIKSRFFNNRLQLNAEGFHYDLDGYQSGLPAVTSTGLVVFVTTNGQKAEIYGGEIEASFLITPRDRLDLSVALLHARFITFIIPGAGDYSGNQMQNAPGHSFTGNYSHTFDLAGGATVVAHGEARYEGDQWADFRNSPGSLVNGFWRLGGDVTYRSADDRWSLGVFARNLTNNGSVMVFNAGLGPQSIAGPLPPRTYGVRASVDF